VALITSASVLIAPLIHRFMHRFHLEMTEPDERDDAKKPATRGDAMPRRASRTRVRTGQGSVALTKEEFRERWLARFATRRSRRRRTRSSVFSPSRGTATSTTARAAEAARGPGIRGARPGAPAEWLDTRAAIRRAQRQQSKKTGRSRVLLICRRVAQRPDVSRRDVEDVPHGEVARAAIEAARGFEVDLLDLSRLASEYGRVIYPCKACVSTAMPLCHWPCSCYPNHGQGQTGDWMNELYPRWVAAHGVMIVTPVYWYQVPGGLKSMMDRLVCADGGNPDPTTTGGKDR